jgi:hypothetical protein
VRRTGLLAIALLAAAAVSAGCGQDANSAAARSVTTRFLSAVGSGDGTVACEQLSAQTRVALEEQDQRECRAAVTQLRLDPGSVSRVRVYVGNAMVELSSGETEFLEQGSEGWRLSAVGCQPHGDRPVDHPYDCELND